MPWHYWVLNRNADANPPAEWVRILGQLKTVIESRYIDKIEVAAFSIRGRRTARWCVIRTNPEYSTKTNALSAAKKLTWLLFKSEDAPDMGEVLTRAVVSWSCATGNTTVCPVCKKVINYEDFARSGRQDPDSIQMGHLEPLSRIRQGHNGENVVWVHRRCNYIQDEQTVEETIMTLKDILERHGYEVTKSR